MGWDPFKRRRKCKFCKKISSNLKYVRYRGMYGDAGWNYAYHEKCLREVICAPEKHKSIDVDMAIEIIDLIKEWKAVDKKEAEKCKERCEYLKKHCV